MKHPRLNTAIDQTKITAYTIGCLSHPAGTKHFAVKVLTCFSSPTLLASQKNQSKCANNKVNN